ncbi:MFS transporter [Alishewanella longhuensis]
MQKTQPLNAVVVANHTHSQVKWMTCLMFFVFAMTTDAVGVIIPEVVKQFNLSLTQAAAFHYVP